MEVLGASRYPAVSFILPPTAISAPQRCKCLMVRAKLRGHENNDGDPFLQSAIERASLRFQETLRPDPLFIDPYVGCLLPSNIEEGSTPQHHPHCLAVKYIDDQLLTELNKFDSSKQVVLLTDGVDTRPYRLNWPRSTLIFDISPDKIFRRVTKEFEGIGAKVPRNCFFLHIPSESSSIQHTLCSKGFNGGRPSIWALQGLPIETLASLKEILFLVSSLAMKDCLFLGELPAWLVDSDKVVTSNRKRQLENIFLSNGFQVQMIQCDEIGKDFGRELELPTGDYENILFAAKHLRYSDAQMDGWRKEFLRIEEEGDEEGFEEL